MTLQARFNPVENLEQSPPKTDWHGSWIWVENKTADRNVYAYFRRTFTSSKAGQLNVAITADSHYTLYVNGRFVCRGPARAPLAYYLFDEHSLKLDAGKHVISVLVHHMGEVNACMMLGRPGLLVDAQLNVNGQVVDFSSGTHWICLPATAWRKDLPDKMSHFGFWEEFDLSHEPAGWKTQMFEDGNWQKPVCIGKPPCTPWERLIARDILLPEYAIIKPTNLVAHGTWQKGDVDPIPSKEVASRKRSLKSSAFTLPFKCSIDTETSGEYITIDFGRTVSGYIELELNGCSAEPRIDISYDEILTDKQAINPERSYAHLTDRYLLSPKTSHLRTTHPRGFRYVCIDIYGKGQVQISQIRAIEETYPFGQIKKTPLTDKKLVDYFNKAAETVRICTTDSFTDCSTRERVQWMEDMYMHAKVAYYAFGDTKMLRHSLFQAAQCTLPDGRINGFFPTDRSNLAFAASSISWLHLLVDYWMFTHSNDIRQLLPTARRCIEFITSQSTKDGIIEKWPVGQFWEWAPIEDNGCLLLTNAAYLLALDRLSKHDVFCDILDNNPENCINKIREAAHAYFWDPQKKLYKDAVPQNSKSTIYSQQANSLAVLSGICPVDGRRALLERIIDPNNLGPVPIGEDSLKEQNRPQDGQLVPVGTLWFAHFVCQALFENGMDKKALEQMHMFWGAFDHLPTFPETRIQHGNTGHCHGWACGPAFLLPVYVAGIKP